MHFGRRMTVGDFYKKGLFFTNWILSTSAISKKPLFFLKNLCFLLIINKKPMFFRWGHTFQKKTRFCPSAKKHPFFVNLAWFIVTISKKRPFFRNLERAHAHPKEHKNNTKIWREMRLEKNQT